jgi:Rrf2 family iron-sulfur cluster assembly transcriptional regulator
MDFPQCNLRLNSLKYTMSLLFSRQCEYALQAVSYLALKPPGTMTSIKEIAKRLNIPYHFLGKILQDLVYKGLLSSQKGPLGGFALAAAPDTMALAQIVEAVDGEEFAGRCVMGFPQCSGERPCAVHSQWGPIRERIRAMLAGENIAEMAKSMKKPTLQSRRRRSIRPD